MLRNRVGPSVRMLLVALCCSAGAFAQSDSCAGAALIGNGVTPGSNATAGSGPDPITPFCGFNVGNDVWYQWIAPCSGTALATFCGLGSANFDTVLTAWSGACGSLTEITCNDDFCGLQSEITWAVTSGTLYTISVAGYNGQTGTFNLQMGCFQAPTNDNCAGAILITEGVATSGTNIGATTGPEPVGGCGAMATDVWFAIIPACSGTYTATTCDAATSYDTVVAIWDGTNGCAGLSTELSCNDDNCGIPSGIHFLNSTTQWTAVAGNTYYISVGGFFGSTGIFNLTVSSGGGLSLNFFDVGAGTIGYQVTGAPAGGIAFTAITLVPGAYPAGWFYGIDIGFADLITEINTGFPFIAGLGPCGSVTVGPFFGLPSGLPLFGVTLGLPPGSPYTSGVSPPASGVVP